MKRRFDTEAASLHDTKRNRSDSSLDEESELSSQGSFMVLWGGGRDIDFHGQFLQLLSMLSVAFTPVSICYIYVFFLFVYFGESLNICWY